MTVIEAIDVSARQQTEQSQTAIAFLCRRIAEDPMFRARFQANPVAEFRSAGLEVSDDFESRAAGKSLTTFLTRGGDPLSRLPAGEVEVPDLLVSQRTPEQPWATVVVVAAVAIASTPAISRPLDDSPDVPEK